MTDETDFAQLIPELPNWNNGAGIDAESWVGCVGSPELAVGYSLIFWPRFVRFENYVLREGFSEDSLRAFAVRQTSTRASVEWVMNHLHIADIHCTEAQASEAQLRYLGRVLAEIHQVKLRADFPDLRFTVEFNDEPGLDPNDYQMSFWQAED